MTHKHLGSTASTKKKRVRKVKPKVLKDPKRHPWRNYKDDPAPKKRWNDLY